MGQQAHSMASVREEALKLILETRIAGQDTRHSRATNLHAIKELVSGHPHYTFGIKGVERFSFEEVLDAIAGITKCSKDPNYVDGGGYISPDSTLKGLELGAKAIYAAAKGGGRFILATGHPGSLMLFYIDLGRLIRDWGGEIIVVERGAFVPPNFDLDYVEDVAVISDRCSIWHSHDVKPMEIILESAGHVDLVVADHGFAGGAINAGIPVVGIVDTNDPALAVAKRMGAHVIVIPMDDNRPLSAYLGAVELIRDLATVGSIPLAADGGSRVSNKELRQESGRLRGQQPSASRGNAETADCKNGGKAGQPLRPDVMAAEKLVKRRMGPGQSLDETIEAFLESFKDQFLQSHFDMVKENDLINNSYVTFSIYNQIRVAMARFIEGQLRDLAPELTREEVDFYLGRRAQK